MNDPLVENVWILLPFLKGEGGSTDRTVSKLRLEADFSMRFVLLDSEKNGNVDSYANFQIFKNLHNNSSAILKFIEYAS